MLRLPDGMREAIKALAIKNNRSMNAEIVARLEALSNLDRILEEEFKKDAENKAEIERLKSEIAKRDSLIVQSEDGRGVVIDILQALAHPDDNEARKYAQFRGAQYLSGVPVDQIGTAKGLEQAQSQFEDEAFRAGLEAGIRKYTQESIGFLSGFLARHGWRVEREKEE